MTEERKVPRIFKSSLLNLASTPKRDSSHEYFAMKPKPRVDLFSQRSDERGTYERVMASIESLKPEQMSDVCMQIVSKALSKYYYVTNQFAC